MSQPISPAIIINERFEARPQIPNGYNVLVTGYTSEGIANEPFIITNVADYVNLFGEPDPARAEQIWAYDSAKRVIDSGANLVFVKLPYGAGEGQEVGDEYSALLYPALLDTSSTEEVTGYLFNESVPASAFGETLSMEAPFSSDIDEGETLSPEDYARGLAEFAGLSSVDTTAISALSDTEGYVFGEPIRITLSEEDFDNIECGQFNWSDDISTFDTTLSAYDPESIGQVGMIVLDRGRSKSQDSREGFYISVTDNTDGDPATDWDAITNIETDTTLEGQNIWSDLPEDSYDFDLTAPFGSNIPSLSQGIASLANQTLNTPWEDGEYKNYLNVTLWRLRRDIQNGSPRLVPTVVESHTGSVSESETVLGEGGVTRNVFLGDMASGSANRINVLINPVISGDEYVNTQGQKTRSTRMYRDGIQGLQSGFESLASVTWGTDRFADSLYSVSRFAPRQVVAEFDIGNVPRKLSNALCTVDNPDRLDLALSVEAGLGTIWTTVKSDPNSWITGDQADGSFTFDDSTYLDVVSDLGRAVPLDSETGNLRILWREVFDIFKDFSEKTRVCNGGYQHLHIADVLRQIVVNGRDCKVYDSRTKCKNAGAFAEFIYHPTKNLTKGINTSVATFDCQWYRANNIYSSTATWVPSSSATAALMARTAFPWLAAAGVNNGIIRDVVDIAVDPVQRDRDLLWKIHANAVFYDRFVDGFLRFADQTLLKNDDIQLRQNSARRLMIWLEMNLKNALRPFFFQPNNLQTRVRFRNEIEIYLNTLLNNGAIEDYAISLSRNTGAAQQDGCLVADIGIKITGVVEQIKLNFNLLRLDEPFQEVF